MADETAPPPLVDDGTLKVINDLNNALDVTHQTLGDTLTKLAAAEKERDQALSEVNLLRGKLKAAKSTPTGDVVFLGGQSYPVVKTVRANTTFDEVKKGFVDEGATLVVIDARH